MIRQQYANFAEGFGDLNPYELDHLSEALLIKFEELLLNSGKEESMQHSLQDIHFAITRTMRDIQIELAESNMADAQYQLKCAHARTFKPYKIVREKTTAPSA
jgi:hypothetical protein